MDRCLQSLAAPEIRRINEALEPELDPPENNNSQRNAPAQWRSDEKFGRGQAQQAQEQDGQRNKEGMHLHHLPVDLNETRQLLLPVEITREDDIDQHQAVWRGPMASGLEEAGPGSVRS